MTLAEEIDRIAAGPRPSPPPKVVPVFDGEVPQSLDALLDSAVTVDLDAWSKVGAE